MDSTLSVSKGIFVFKNGATRATNAARKSKKRTYLSPIGLFGSEVTHQPFYATYTATWRNLQNDIEELQKKSSTQVLKELVDYVMQETNANEDNFDMHEILPTAALLTGINQPDHLKQFSMFSGSVREQISARVCILEARDCTTLKATIEGMVYKLIEQENNDNSENVNDNENDDDIDEECDHKRLRRSQCTIKELQRWYSNNFCPNENNDNNGTDINLDVDEFDYNIKRQRYIKPALVIILPDFESFSVPVLQDFILILSAQRTRLPFVLVLGVATSVSVVHHTLAYHVTSKIKLRIFQTQSSSVEINEIVEKVILSPKYTFHLSGKAFKFLTHIFLYYDFSINGFIQGFKYCLMEHFFQGNAYSLCTSYSTSLEYVKTIGNAEVANIRRLLSFRPYVESLTDCKSIIDILTNDNYLLKKLPSLLFNCHTYLLLFRTFLEFFLVLVEDLPKCPLGKYRRELYALCLSREVSEQPEFKESWQMLSFLSKDEFVNKMQKAITATEYFVKMELQSIELGTECAIMVDEILTPVKSLLDKVIVAGLEAKTSPTIAVTTSTNITPTAIKDGVKTITSRQELKEHLLQMSKNERVHKKADFSKAVADILDFIHMEIVKNYLRPLKRAPPLHELFIFNNVDTVRRHIIGAPRGALHMALTNPHHYLQCNCCKLREYSQLLPTMPDISIAYKLHLECGRLINLYDWLQAFRTVVEPQVAEETDEVDPEIQARFTRAVAELQFLGFIKMSKRKRDHVQRLTW